MDNACKYGDSQVLVSATGTGRKLILTVEDDGPGIPPELHDDIVQRGARADSSRPGQGIGLAVADDIATSYGGSMELSQSSLGGSCITLRFHAQD